MQQIEEYKIGGKTISRLISRTVKDSSKSQYLKNLLGLTVEEPTRRIKQVRFEIPKRSKYFEELIKRFGKKEARIIRKQIRTPEFQEYFGGQTPEQLEEINRYAIGRRVNQKIMGDPLQGKGVLGGSMALADSGTVIRETAVPHDLDYSAYIGRASHMHPHFRDGGERQQWFRLRHIPNVEQSEIYKTLQQNFGELPIITLPYAPKILPRPLRKIFYRLTTPQDKTGAFYITHMQNRIPVEGDVLINRTAQTTIGGVPIDVFLTDTLIPSTTRGVQPAPYILHVKNLWGRPKDLKDVDNFQFFGKQNPIIDLETGQHQYSPLRFGNDLVTEQGFPIVQLMETYPGSGIQVPVVMNYKGQFRVVGSKAPIQQTALSAEQLSEQIPEATNGSVQYFKNGKLIFRNSYS